MGTRHYQKVINREGEVKVEQYGQWDGYPSGQGRDILEFLHGANLEKYLENLNKLEQLDVENADRIQKMADEIVAKKLGYSDEREELSKIPEYYSVTRDCGAKIHKLIENGEIKYVRLTDEEEANRWCEGFFTIDFEKNTFTTKYGNLFATYELDKLPTEEKYLEDLNEDEDED